MFNFRISTPIFKQSHQVRLEREARWLVNDSPSKSHFSQIQYSNKYADFQTGHQIRPRKKRHVDWPTMLFLNLIFLEFNTRTIISIFKQVTKSGQKKGDVGWPTILLLNLISLSNLKPTRTYPTYLHNIIINLSRPKTWIFRW